MSKIVCDICGTTYDDSTGACPVCGWNPGTPLDNTYSAEDAGDLDLDYPLDDDTDAADASAQKSKAVFDYDAVNPRRRRPAPAPAPAPEEEEEEESGSNKFLVFVLVILILALIAVSGYIAYTKLWKPSQMGSDDNKPQETISGQPADATEPAETVAGETAPTGETTAVTEPDIPCTDLYLVATMDTLTYAGQYWRLMVQYAPNDTTDKLTFTSGDENVVTVDEFGRVTAVGEGETVITIACGDKRIEMPAVVKYPSAETEAPTVAPTTAAGTAESGTGTGTVATPSSGNVLKLKKSDVTIGRRGVYITLELENGIAAEDVKWSTSDSSIATVYNGNVTAIGRGTCVIYAKYNGQVAECVVRCKF